MLVKHHKDLLSLNQNRISFMICDRTVNNIVSVIIYISINKQKTRKLNKIRATESMWRVSFIFGNFISQSFGYCAQSPVCHCSRIATVNIFIVSGFFQFFCSKVLLLSLQVYYSSIPSLKLKLSATYNYSCNLSKNYSKTTQFIKNKLKWMFMQNSS